MSALAAARLGVWAWSWRRPAARIALAALGLGALLPALAFAAILSGPELLQPPLQRATVTQPFGCTAVTLEPVSALCATGHFHSGIDLGAGRGTPVYAATSGMVQVKWERGGFGLYLVLSRDPVFTTVNGHLDCVAVSSGDWVAAGQLIGRVGTSGNSTGPHLHFEVQVSGTPVDPLPLLPPGVLGGDAPA